MMSLFRKLAKHDLTLEKLQLKDVLCKNNINFIVKIFYKPKV